MALFIRTAINPSAPTYDNVGDLINDCVHDVPCLCRQAGPLAEPVPIHREAGGGFLYDLIFNTLARHSFLNYASRSLRQIATPWRTKARDDALFGLSAFTCL
jgi:hypothetical protein